MPSLKLKASIDLRVNNKEGKCLGKSLKDVLLILGVFVLSGGPLLSVPGQHTTSRHVPESTPALYARAA